MFYPWFTRAAMRASLAGFVVLVSAACATGGGPDAGPGGTSADPSAPADGANAQVDPDGYVLGQGDRISIQVFDEPDLTMEATIGASGVINYSYLGNVRVADRTPQQIESNIVELLQDGFLVNPSVNVTVAQYRPFFINGEVRSPGGYPYQPGLTLDRAIALAGGLTDRASDRKITIVKAGQASDERRATMSTRIAPGDIISVKEGFF